MAPGQANQRRVRRADWRRGVHRISIKSAFVKNRLAHIDDGHTPKHTPELRRMLRDAPVQATSKIHEMRVDSAISAPPITELAVLPNAFTLHNWAGIATRDAGVLSPVRYPRCARLLSERHCRSRLRIRCHPRRDRRLLEPDRPKSPACRSATSSAESSSTNPVQLRRASVFPRRRTARASILNVGESLIESICDSSLVTLHAAESSGTMPINWKFSHPNRSQYVARFD